MDVRHVLIVPEGDEEPTEEQWESCRKKAQALLDGWVKAGATEEGFAKLAVENSVDSSASNGGLIQSIVTGQMVEAFDAWCFDESRKVGDYGLVRTEYGYHLMYYVGGDEAWYIVGKNSQDGIVYTNCAKVIDAQLEANPLDVKFDKILIGTAVLTVQTAENNPTAATE